MNQNKNLHRALKVKNDEFYTRLEDIEQAMPQYHPYLKGKSLLLPCDDYRHSQFYHYFKDYFHQLGLLRLQAIGYQKNSRGIFCEYDGKSEKVELLEGNGDFYLDETQEKIKNTDVIVTNPPYSLFQQFFSWVLDNKKDFIVLGNINALTQKRLFDAIKDGKCFIGNHFASRFISPDNQEIVGAHSLWYSSFWVDTKGVSLTSRYTPEKYPPLDNIHAINIDKTKDIPMDYKGIMAVPISYLPKHNHKQFEIVGLDRFIYREIPELYKSDVKLGRTDVSYLNGKVKYRRVLIKAK